MIDGQCVIRPFSGRFFKVVVYVYQYGGGIRTRRDVERLEAAGVQAMLVGESLLDRPDIGAAVDELLGTLR